MLVVAAAVSGYSSRDWGVFVLELVTFPCLALIAVCIIGVSFARHEYATARLAVVLVVIAPIAFAFAATFRDRIAFYSWALAHPAVLHGAIARDGVVLAWDGWGFAGDENSSYLAVDPTDSLGTVSGAAAWRARNRLPCDVVDATRLRARLYIVVTYNCVFDERRLPQR